MQEQRARGGSPVWRGGAGWLALPLAFACGHSESATWVGTQDCSVLIPPEQSPSVQIPPVSTALPETQLALTGDGFYLQKFLIAPVPIAGFSCEPIPLQVTAHFTQRDATQNPAARPVLARGITLDPFKCRATDGRTYTLTGTGQADLRAIFFNMTFSAWLGPGQATLMCTTRFLQQLADAGAPDGVASDGVAPNIVDMQTPDPAAGAETLPLGG